MTEFRMDQAKLLLITVLRTLAPRMAGKGTLRKLVKELADNGPFWAELDASWQPRPRRPATTPQAGVLEAPVQGR